MGCTVLYCTCSRVYRTVRTCLDRNTDTERGYSKTALESTRLVAGECYDKVIKLRSCLPSRSRLPTSLGSPQAAYQSTASTDHIIHGA